MKQVWIINQFANTPNMPGHTRQYETAIGLSRRGWKVSVISSDFNLTKRVFLKLKRFRILLKEDINGVSWTWLRVTSYKRNNWRRIINWISFCSILSIVVLIKIFKNSFNNRRNIVILASSPQLPAAFILWILCYLFRIKFVLEVRDLWPQVLIDNGSSKDSLIIKILLWMEKILYLQSNAVVTLSKGAIKYIKQKGAKKVYWLPNGANTDKFYFSELPFEANGFSKERPFVAIYAGAHGEANDLSIIVEAAHILKDEPIKFLLIGDGPEKKKLLNKAKNLNNIEFRDPISKKDMPFLLSQSDAVLLCLKDLPLFSYGVSPNKLYDAYSSGRPIVTNVSGLIKQEIQDHNLGLTVNPGDPKHFAKVINELKNSPRSLRATMGRNARSLAEDVYSRTKINGKYHKIISKLILK